MITHSKLIISRIAVVVMFLLCFESIAQNKLNFGLSQPQDAATLPKSKVAIQMPTRKAKISVPCVLKTGKDNEFLLSSGWEMLEADKAGATGENISTQLAQVAYPSPPETRYFHRCNYL